jgi:HK97 family phage major capsid protein
MNRLDILKSRRRSLVADIAPLAGLRSLTTAQKETFNSAEREIRSIDSDIAHDPDTLRQTNPFLGLTRGEIARYSINRAINCLLSNRPLDGLEAAASDAEQKRCGRDMHKGGMGFFVPAEIFARDRRALQASDSSLGGNTVASQVATGLTVPLLRNGSRVVELGGRVISGLVGNADIPRVLTGSAVYWLTETGQVAQSNPTFGQIALKPRQLGASVQYTRQFLAQSSLDAELFVQDDINSQMGVELDRVAIAGKGGVEPLGILNLSASDRAPSVTFGASATWAKILAFENNVENANALINDPAYLTTPNAKTKWKAIQKASNNAIYLWETPGNSVNGCRARSSLNVPGDVAVFGDFSQVIFGEWIGNQIVVDPFTDARKSLVNLTLEKQIDVVIRQAKAFSVSTDSAAQ